MISFDAQKKQQQKAAVISSRIITKLSLGMFFLVSSHEKMEPASLSNLRQIILSISWELSKKFIHKIRVNLSSVE